MIIWMDGPLANDPPFPSLLFFSFAKKHIFLLQIFSSSKYCPPFPLLLIFSPAKSIFLSPNIFLTLHSWFCLTLKNIFSSSKFNPCFPSFPTFYFSSKKRIPFLNIILLFLHCSSFPPKTPNSKF